MSQKLEELQPLIQAMLKEISSRGLDQRVYLMEECSEFVKEYCKDYRNKMGYRTDVCEAMDIVVAAMIFLSGKEITFDYFADYAIFKMERALDRYAKGEL